MTGAQQALWALLGTIALAVIASSMDEMNLTDCKERAKKAVGFQWFNIWYADHETLLSDPEYVKAYKHCKRELV